MADKFMWRPHMFENLGFKIKDQRAKVKEFWPWHVPNLGGLVSRSIPQGLVVMLFFSTPKCPI